MDFWHIFLYSFLVALTGAMSPGPLLTYTIFKSIKAKEKGVFIGILVILGHAILEFCLIIGIFLGIGPFLQHQIAVIIIGLLGGGLLIYFGVSIIRDLLKERIDFSFLEPDMAKISQKIKENKLFKMNPLLGGIFISLSNPYWIIWWVTWGLNAITAFSVSLSVPSTFWGFFLGHEAGDFIWYVPIATIAGLFSKIMTKKIYIGILIACAVFMIGFGLYLAISPLIFL
ncbi:MAG: LysE family transporter [Promethearchaeota archaeon]